MRADFFSWSLKVAIKLNYQSLSHTHHPTTLCRSTAIIQYIYETFDSCCSMREWKKKNNELCLSSQVNEHVHALDAIDWDCWLRTFQLIKLCNRLQTFSSRTHLNSVNVRIQKQKKFSSLKSMRIQFIQIHSRFMPHYFRLAVFGITDNCNWQCLLLLCIWRRSEHHFISFRLIDGRVVHLLIWLKLCHFTTVMHSMLMFTLSLVLLTELIALHSVYLYRVCARP